MFSSSKRRGNARDTSARSPRLSSASASRGKQAVRSAIEPLETRVLMSVATYHVLTAGDTTQPVFSTGNGVNDFDAPTLRSAVAAANASAFDSVIVFDTADYTGGANQISLSANLTLTKNSHTYTITNTTGKPIVVDGGGAHTDFVTNAGVKAEIDNLTIQHGLATQVFFGNLDGGGIAANGPLVLNNDNFIGNSAPAFQGSGGGVYSNTGTLTINGGSFVANNASFGGGVYTQDTATNESPSISNVSFSDNTAVDNGGAVENDSFFNSTLTLTNDSFTGNASTFFAPVSSLSEPAGGTLTTNINGCSFDSNKGGTGGAVYTGSANQDGVQNTTLNVTNSTFTNNDATFNAGGGIFSDDHTITVNGSTFDGNLGVTGSGLFIDGQGTLKASIDSSTFKNAQGTPFFDASLTDVDTVSNSTFTANTAPAGGSGGIHAGGKSLTVTASTFSNDTVTGGGNGGAIGFVGGAGSTLTVSGASTFTSDTSVTGNGGAIFSSAATTTVSGATFTNDSSGSGNGGAIFNKAGLANGSLTLSSDTFTNDSAVGGSGGAVFDNGGAPSTFTSSNSTYTGNTARRGGAIFTNGGAGSSSTSTGDTFKTNTATATGGGAVFSGVVSLTLASDTFTGNQSLGGGVGGAVDAADNNLTVTGSSFANDLANGNGGGIDFTGVTGKITGTTFDKETAGNLSSGGALFATATNLTLTLDKITNSKATNFGGGVSASVTGLLSIESSTLSGDSATNGGGGLFATEPAAGGILNIFNSTLFGDSTNFGGGGGINATTDGVVLANDTLNANKAGNDVGGGGVALLASAGGQKATIFDSTISGNSAGLALGGGISNAFAGAVAATLRGTIVAGNTASGSTTGNDLAGKFNGSFNLIGDGTNEAGLVNGVNNNQVGTSVNKIDPLLSPLAFNGGPTETMALKAGSPAIGQGSAFVVNDVNNIDITALDQRGVARPQVPNGFDIGAYESGPVVASVDHLVFVSVPASVVAGTPFSVVVEALTPANTVDTSFSDTVSFSSTGATSPAALPQNVGFVNGTYTLNTSFTTPSAAGYTITATDTTPGSGVAAATSSPIVVSTVVVGAPVATITGPGVISKPSSGTTLANFTVNLSAPAPAGGVVVSYQTVGGTASSGAGDYVGKPVGSTITIPAGATSGVISVTVNGNTKVNPDRTFSVQINSVTGATLGVPSTATATIHSGAVVGVTPTISISDATAKVSSTMTFTVTLSAPAPAGGVTVDFTTMQGTASSGHGDYVGQSGKVLTFAAGQTTATIKVVINSAKFPAAKYAGGGVYFYVLLTNANNAILGDGTGIGTITL